MQTDRDQENGPSPPSTAICIPTYNQAEFLVHAVESAFAQTYANVEVWVSDDCSTDETQTAAETLMRRFPSLRYHRQKCNLGISANNNWLLSQPQTDFIVRLDSDDFLDSKYVEDLIGLMVKYPASGYAHCAVQEIDKHDRLRRTRMLSVRPEFQSAEQALRASAGGYRVAANICLFRAEALRALQYYRAEVEYVQDWDLSVRLADQGWGNVYSGNVLASYRMWEDEGQARPRRKRAELEGYVQVFEESLAPAFQARGWSLSFLEKRRKALALAQAVSLDSDLFSAAERAQLLCLLNKLGPSAKLSFRVRLIKCGFGPVLRWANGRQLACKDVLKRIIVKIRKRQAIVSAKTTA